MVPGGILGGEYAKRGKSNVRGPIGCCRDGDPPDPLGRSLPGLPVCLERAPYFGRGRGPTFETSIGLNPILAAGEPLLRRKSPLSGFVKSGSAISVPLS